VRLLTAAALLLATAATAQTLPAPSDLEPLLLPVTVKDAPGAFGSRWSTELWMSLDDDKLPGFVAPLFGDSACDPPCPLPGGPAPGTFLIGFFRTHPDETPGSLLYVAKDVIEKVHVSILLREDALGFNAPPLQIPVVRRSLASSGRLSLMNLPLQAASRQMLRVYSFDPAHPPAVRVRAFADPDDQMFYDATFTLAATQRMYDVHGETATLSLPIRPPALQLPVPVAPAALHADRVRIEVTPLTGAQPLWAFVTITDNLTQNVTLRLPQ
jgi:hypothetical protein